jgi:hypothetical protein
VRLEGLDHQKYQIISSLIEPATFQLVPRIIMVEICLHSPICLYGVVNYTIKSRHKFIFTVFWDMTLCSAKEIRCFTATYCLFLQGRRGKVGQANRQRDPTIELSPGLHKNVKPIKNDCNSDLMIILNHTIMVAVFEHYATSRKVAR